MWFCAMLIPMFGLINPVSRMNIAQEIGGGAKLSSPCGVAPRDSASYAFWCFQLRAVQLRAEYPSTVTPSRAGPSPR